MNYDLLFTPTSRQVLCPQLYHKLKDLFRSVTVANEGMEMTPNIVFDYTRQRHHNSPAYCGEYYRVHCPFCGDTRKRLWINYMYGQQDPANGRPMYWLATCYNENCLQNFENSKQLREALFGFENANARNRTPFEVLPGEQFDGFLRPVQMPGECVPVAELSDEHPAFQWLAYEKHYTREMMQRYQLSFCVAPSPQYRTAQNRIVFPVIMDGNLVGWQCRYVGKANWKFTPKYYTLPGFKAKFTLYNFDIARHCPFVVVCEGPTSANAVGDYAVALLGKSISPQQLSMLTMTWERKPIVLLLDPDAREEMRGILHDLLRAGTNPVVEVVLPEGVDPNDLDRHTIWRHIYNAASESGLKL